MSDAAAPPARLASLDALRGIAAFVVVLHHFSLVIPGVAARIDAIWPLQFLVAGRAAVVIFFLLSGFVLYLSLERHDRSNWATFAVRRLARLYPPLAIAILLSAVLYFLVHPVPLPGLQDWVTRYSWNEVPGAELISGHLLLLDTDRFHSLDNPMWSLIVEIRLSLLFPFIAAGIRKWPIATTLGCMIIAFISRALLMRGHQTMLIDPLLTLQFIDLFALGALFAREHERIARLVRSIPAGVMLAIGVAALCRHGRFELYASYLGAVLLVTASFAYPRLAGFYDARPFVWLGERSFSLYLVHVPLLLATVYALDGPLPLAAILGIALPICLVGAELFWLGVERPSLNLSRWAGRALTRRAKLAT